MLTDGPLRRLGLLVVCVILLSLAMSRSGAVHQFDAVPVSRPGLSGAIGPEVVTCRGVPVSVTDDIQGVVDRNPAGTTFCLAAGIHRLVLPVEPKEGDAFIGQRGAVLSGSKVLSGWRISGRVWSAPGSLPSAPVPDDERHCRESAPTCTYAEDVFVNKKRLTRVGSASAVRAGTVYADYGSNTIIIGDDPRFHLVEQAVAPSLIQGTVDNVTVADLVLEEAANDAQVGAVESRQVTPHRVGAGWQILHNEVRLNHGVGLGFADHARITANVIHHQGQLGFGAWGTGSVLSNNEISFNGTAGYSPDWEAGGGKSWQTDGETITHNFVHDNWGPGVWADGGNLNTRYEYNKIIDNRGAGIQHEISYDASILHNEVSGNGRTNKGWAWGAGIQIQSSGGARSIEIAYNVVDDNANGITLIDSGRRARELPAPHGPHIVRNVWVHDNTVTMSPGQFTGAVEDTGDRAIFTSNHNRFDRNTYHLRSVDQSAFVWADTELTWAGWRTSGGQDPHGRAGP